MLLPSEKQVALAAQATAKAWHWSWATPAKAAAEEGRAARLPSRRSNAVGVGVDERLN
jgi:hypothetical protein